MRKTLLLALLGLSLTGCNANEMQIPAYEYYPLLMEVTEIEKETGYAIATDSTGNEWAFDREDSFVGELYACIMNDNGTEEIEDDYIVNMRYSGQATDFINIVSYDATETGIFINYDDGSGFYIGE